MPWTTALARTRSSRFYFRFCRTSLPSSVRSIFRPLPQYWISLFATTDLHSYSFNLDIHEESNLDLNDMDTSKRMAGCPTRTATESLRLPLWMTGRRTKRSTMKLIPKRADEISMSLPQMHMKINKKHTKSSRRLPNLQQALVRE